MTKIYYFIDEHGNPGSTRPKLGVSYDVINHRGWSTWDEVVASETESGRVFGSYVGYETVEDLISACQVSAIELLSRI